MRAALEKERSKLLPRVEAAPLAAVLAETIFDPLDMSVTGFAVPAGQLDRMTSYYRRDLEGDGLALGDPPDGQWATTPTFPSGAGGLVSTADDWLTFGRMLLAQGEHRGQRVLSAESVRLRPQATSRPRRATPSSMARDGASAAASISTRPSRGTSPAATAGSAAPGRRVT